MAGGDIQDIGKSLRKLYTFIKSPFDLEIDVYEGDIYTNNGNKTGTGIPENITAEYNGDQPHNNPKTGDIKAPADKDLLILSLTVGNTDGATGDESNVDIKASNNADEDSGDTLTSFTAVKASQTYSGNLPLILPKGKYLTGVFTVNAGSPGSAKITNVKVIERGDELDEVLLS
ncbi:MAG: hypothetical protein GWN01_01420 [Nitrosopumilaceae archaeon]|nr:hypothetical protein [Nitrosopumilaceae archaeon]NIU86018.1 hypothetical protein [Nitrosopumilaceae archaeon]NIX60237.1 hypothetical protein [Nitrosopumilaceae archaeon]